MARQALPEIELLPVDGDAPAGSVVEVGAAGGRASLGLAAAVVAAALGLVALLGSGATATDGDGGREGLPPPTSAPRPDLSGGVSAGPSFDLREGSDALTMGGTTILLQPDGQVHRLDLAGRPEQVAAVGARGVVVLEAGAAALLSARTGDAEQLGAASRLLPDPDGPWVVARGGRTVQRIGSGPRLVLPEGTRAVAALERTLVLAADGGRVLLWRREGLQQVARDAWVLDAAGDRLVLAPTDGRPIVHLLRDDGASTASVTLPAPAVAARLTADGEAALVHLATGADGFARTLLVSFAALGEPYDVMAPTPAGSEVALGWAGDRPVRLSPLGLQIGPVVPAPAGP